jgi:23S rRNA pseudouridine2605 synthase
MRINRYLALATGMSRRAADLVIAEGQVTVNGQTPQAGQDVTEQDKVLFQGRPVQAPASLQTIALNKPVGYVVSRDGQGSPIVYDLLPAGLHNLKPVGRLDKDSSGLLLLTNDGTLAQELTHPKHTKEKIYELTLDKPLLPADREAIERGVTLEDGKSQLQLRQDGSEKQWRVIMHEGRNRQIRRTFEARGYAVRKLRRTHFGSYSLGQLPPGHYQTL